LIEEGVKKNQKEKGTASHESLTEVGPNEETCKAGQNRLWVLLGSTKKKKGTTVTRGRNRRGKGRESIEEEKRHLTELGLGRKTR